MPGNDQRYRDLMGRIDGGVRKKQLEAELTQLRSAFMEIHGNAERQESFVKKSKDALALLKKKDAKAAREAGEPEEDSGAKMVYVSRESIISTAEERALLAWLQVEHLAEEIESLEARIKEIDEAGLPKTKGEETGTGAAKEKTAE